MTAVLRAALSSRHIVISLAGSAGDILYRNGLIAVKPHQPKAAE
ncbi:hypothetical protein [Bacillus sp. FSL R5-0434]